MTENETGKSVKEILKITKEEVTKPWLCVKRAIQYNEATDNSTQQEPSTKKTVPLLAE